MEATTTASERYESNVRSYCRRFPVVFERARGATLVARSGREYVDFFAGAGALNYGHNPPEIMEALVAYLSGQGVLHALDLHTTAKERWLERFVEIVLRPRGLGSYKVQLTGPAGTDAVEASLKLARKVTGRSTIVAFGGSYHGMTQGSVAASGQLASRTTHGAAGTYFVPFPDGPGGSFDSVGYLRRMLDDPHSGLSRPAAVILETVQMEGGVYIAPAPVLRELRALCDAHDIVLICDEIQAGCGRTGPFFSFERASIVPDVVTVSKSIAGAGLPMAMVLIREDLDRWAPGEHTGTFRGFQPAFVGADAALSYWEDDALAAAVARNEGWIRTFLGDRVLARHPRIRARGLGMAWGLDFSALGAEVAGAVASQCFRDGLIAECCGRRGSVLKLLPPLVIGQDLLEAGLSILAGAIDAVIDRGELARSSGE